MSIEPGELHRQLVERRCVDVLQPEIRWCDGLSEAVKIHAIAEAAGLPTVPHAGGATPAGLHFSVAMA